MFTDAQTVTFECSLDGSPFTSCGYGLFGSKSYPGPLATGRHRFEVRASSGDALSAATPFTWTIVQGTPDSGCGHDASPGRCGGSAGTGTGTGSHDARPPGTGSGSDSSQGGGQPPTGGSQGSGSTGGTPPSTDQPAAGGEVSFRVSGDVTGLAPGVTRTITLTVTNPNTVPIYVTMLEVAIAGDSKPSGCSSSANVVVHQATGITSAAPLTIPAGGTVEVSTFPRAPRITFRNLASSQDACRNKTFALTYTGSAHS